MATESLNCPNCGAPLTNAGGASTVVCDHCGSVVAIKASAAPRPSAPPAAPDTRHEIDPRYEYGPTPAQRPVRSDLASVALGPAEAAHVIQLLRDNQEQAATQFYQAKVGGSGEEAQDAIAAIQAGLRDAAAPVMPSAMPTSNPADLPEVRRQLEVGDTIGAIKAYRYATGQGLREAKTAVEGLERQLYPDRGARAPVMGNPARSRSWGCAVVPVVILGLFICIFGGCSAYVQNQTAYRCALGEVLAAIRQGDYLSPPINTSALVVVTEMHNGTTSGGEFVGATLLTPVWGSKGFGLLYVSFNSVDSLTENYVGANLYTPGQAVSLLPFRYSTISRSYSPAHTYACER